jgi:hypothetical protein
MRVKMLMRWVLRIVFVSISLGIVMLTPMILSSSEIKTSGILMITVRSHLVSPYLLTDEQTVQHQQYPRSGHSSAQPGRYHSILTE